MIDKIYGFLGLAMKAGKIAFGADMCEEKIKKGEACLLIIAEDLSDNTKSKFIKLAQMNHINVVEFGKIEVLSDCIGKINKGVIAVLDSGFADKLLQMVNIVKGANN